MFMALSNLIGFSFSKDFEGEHFKKIEIFSQIRRRKDAAGLLFFRSEEGDDLFEARIVAEWIPVGHQTIRPSRKEADQAGIR
jgi:hypothetical protein